MKAGDAANTARELARFPTPSALEEQLVRYPPLAPLAPASLLSLIESIGGNDTIH